MQSNQIKLINCLPDVPSQFCFNKNEFIDDKFEVDLFVSKHQNKLSLEQLKENLSIYLRTLRLSLIDLINKDYEQFLNLSSSFIGLDTNISNLIYPIKCIKNEVKKNLDDIQIIIKSFNENSNYLKLIQRKKKGLIFILNASQQIKKIEDIIKKNNINDDEIERIAFQINEINQKLKILDFDPIFVNEEFREKVNELLIKIDEYLEQTFFENFKIKNVKKVKEILQIFALNQRLYPFLKNVLKKIFYKKLNDYICSQNVEKFGVIKFYDILYNIIDEDIKLFQSIYLEGTNLLSKVLNLLCDMITENLILSASSLFLLGNAEIFILNYKETNKFFDKFFCLTNSSESVKKNSSFIKLKKKFNCEIYFHLRLKEVSNSISKSIKEPILFDNQQSDKFNNLLKIKLISNILDLIKYIWSDKIFIDSLFCEFWLLTLNLISKFTLFLKNFNHEFLIKLSGKDNVKLQISILIYLIKESNFFLDSLRKVYFTDIKYKMPQFCNSNELDCCLNESLDSLTKHGIPCITNLIKEITCKQCYLILSETKEIPRLYRKTNREIPFKPSNYIMECANYLNELKSIEKFSKVLIKEILNQVTSDFYLLTNEVFNSVHKMEDSLRKLKKVQNNYNENFKNLEKKVNIKSDEEKIRLQLKHNVNFYRETLINNFEINEQEIINFQDLLKLTKFIEN